MGVAKVNGGSSYENQGDRDKDDVPSNGANIPTAAYSKPAKHDAKAWQSKSYSNPGLPDYLA